MLSSLSGQKLILQLVAMAQRTLGRPHDHVLESDSSSASGSSVLMSEYDTGEADDRPSPLAREPQPSLLISTIDPDCFPSDATSDSSSDSIDGTWDRRKARTAEPRRIRLARDHLRAALCSCLTILSLAKPGRGAYERRASQNPHPSLGEDEWHAINAEVRHPWKCLEQSLGGLGRCMSEKRIMEDKSMVSGLGG